MYNNGLTRLTARPIIGRQSQTAIILTWFESNDLLTKDQRFYVGHLAFRTLLANVGSSLENQKQSAQVGEPCMTNRVTESDLKKYNTCTWDTKNNCPRNRTKKCNSFVIELSKASNGCRLNSKQCRP